MAPLTQTLSAFLLLLSAASSTPVAAPAAAAKAANTFTITVGNITEGIPVSQCFIKGTTKTLTGGPATLHQCVQLGDTFEVFEVNSVGKNLAKNDLRCFFLTTGDCENPMQSQENFLGDASQDENHCKEPTPFNAILYTDKCSTGSGGKL